MGFKFKHERIPEKPNELKDWWQMSNKYKLDLEEPEVAERDDPDNEKLTKDYTPPTLDEIKKALKEVNRFLKKQRETQNKDKISDRKK